MDEVPWDQCQMLLSVYLAVVPSLLVQLSHPAVDVARKQFQGPHSGFCAHLD